MKYAKVRLLRPLDGYEVGQIVEYPESDAERLAEQGALEIVGKSADAVATKMETAPLNKSKVK